MARSLYVSLLLVFLLLPAVSNAGQEGSVKGKVNYQGKPLSGAMHQPGVGRKRDRLFLHHSVDDDFREVRGLRCARARRCPDDLGPLVPRRARRQDGPRGRRCGVPPVPRPAPTPRAWRRHPRSRSRSCSPTTARLCSTSRRSSTPPYWFCWYWCLSPELRSTATRRGCA